LEGIGHLIPGIRVTSHVHHPVGIEPVRVERAAVHDEVGPTGRREPPSSDRPGCNASAELEDKQGQEKQAANGLFPHCE